MILKYEVSEVREIETKKTRKTFLLWNKRDNSVNLSHQWEPSLTGSGITINYEKIKVGAPEEQNFSHINDWGFDAQKFPIKDLFSKCDQILSYQQIWSHLLKKSFIQNFNFCGASTGNWGGSNFSENQERLLHL